MRAPNIDVAQQRRWVRGILIAGTLGLVADVGFKLGGARVHFGSLLFLSLGLICIARGLASRLDYQATRPKLAETPRSVLIHAGCGLVTLSWLLLTV